MVNPLEKIIDYTEKQSLALPHNYRSGFFADKFENLANFRVQHEGTGSESLEQIEGGLDAFAVAGISWFLQVDYFCLHLFYHP